jgi:transposase
LHPVLREGDRGRLTTLTRSTSVRAGLAQRARIIVLAADGESNTKISKLVGVTRQTVISWRARYAECGIDGLADEKRSGRPRTIDHRKIVSETLTPPPKKLVVTHWSTRLLADRLKISNSTVADAWREYGVQP